MTLSTFFQKFDQFADAPDAVPKMRELVLELAVRGRLLSSGTHPSAPSAPSEPFPIPNDWQWIALNQAADCRAAAKVDSSSLNDSDWVLDLEDIDGGAGKIIATATTSLPSLGSCGPRLCPSQTRTVTRRSCCSSRHQFVSSILSRRTKCALSGQVNSRNSPTPNPR